ncbi:MAG: NDP-sugar synthase [Sphaerochaeta sp.]|jgi:UTP-glucose-1-phosphate uridylyltransferase|uniref:nucleotidyltransferase family protein n=1 Tax=Sphaerochaeta sp. TaxID=1972642 RepID=UPI003D1300EE
MKPTLLVMAAGMGSRYGGIKQIDSVGNHGETLLDYGVYDAHRSGFEKVVFIIRKDIEKDFRERLFDRIANNMDATYVFQSQDALLTEEQKRLAANRKKPWGTIHAVLCAENTVKEPFAVINADDYYGREAFAILAGHLANLEPGSKEHAMVGYVLDHTMSKSGTVSRAICNVKDGYLVSMEEHTKIGYEGDKVVSHQSSGDIVLTGKEWVSMNFFGFSPTAFESFNSYWDAFIKDHITSEKTECYLPNGASNIVTTGEGKMRFYTTQESWFGMTYSEDKDIVKNELAKKVSSGYYPDKLWKL